MRTPLLTLITCLFVLPANAKYSGGTGEPNDPYQIATAADLIALGEEPNDYDKHFLLTADIDLDPNLPGREVFDKAVIAPDGNDATVSFEGTPFTGVFDGNDHIISHLTIAGGSCLGLFGQLGEWEAVAELKNLGVVDVNIAGSGNCVAGLVGSSYAAVTQCYSTGAVRGSIVVGGLVGSNEKGSVIRCYSTGGVTGDWGVGGLVGSSHYGRLADCYSAGVVKGKGDVGGLVGWNLGDVVADCFSSGAVSGSSCVGGLVGDNCGDSYGYGRIATSYATATVLGESDVGGLVGANGGDVVNCHSSGPVSGTVNVGGLVGTNRFVFGSAMGVVMQCWSSGIVAGGSNIGGLVGCSEVPHVDTVTVCFWDTETSGCGKSDGGMGRTTAQMQTASTFLDAGWDFVGETANGTEDIWWIDEGRDYPRLWWELIPER